MLSQNEVKTIEAYKIISLDRNATHGNPDFWRLEFESFNKLLPDGRVLDIGCGAGRDALLFEATNNYKYLGIDLSVDMLGAAKKLAPNTQFLKMSMYNMAFLNHTFDGFWAAASLLHLPKKHVQEVLTEIKRITKTGGIGFLSLKYGLTEEMVKEPCGTERFFAFYTKREFWYTLAESGFEVIEGTQNRNKVWLTYLVKNL